MRRVTIGQASLKACAACAVALALSLVVVELVARLAIFGSDALSYERMNSWGPLPPSEYVSRRRPSDHPPYLLKPNLDVLFKGARLRTNSSGFADREFQVDKAVGTERIAVIGDSLTMPTGVDLESSFHKRIEKRVASEPGRKVEFLNFAVGAYGALDYLGILRDFALRYSPDLVVICWSLPGDVLFSAEPTSFPEPPRPMSGFHRLWSLEFLLPQPPPSEAFWTSWDEVDRLLDELDGLRGRGGFALLHVILSQLSKPNDGSFVRLKAELVRRLAERSMAVADVDARFDSMVPPPDRGRLWISRFDEHPDEQAHEIYAKILYDAYFREHFALGEPW